jgi:hypothetical protein
MVGEDKTGGIYEPWIADCPLHYTSPNAPAKRDILGTVLLSVLSGHLRYAHISLGQGWMCTGSPVMCQG